MRQSLASYEIVYLSAITLSLYDDGGRARLFAGIKRARVSGAQFAFDTNFRARGWPDLDVARAVYRNAFDLADIVLASTEDLLPLYPEQPTRTCWRAFRVERSLLKLAEPASILRLEGALHQTRAEALTRPVVDTTAAGDVLLRPTLQPA